MAQSVAIGRYLARKYKLAGETPMEEFRADEIIVIRNYIKLNFSKQQRTDFLFLSIILGCFWRFEASHACDSHGTGSGEESRVEERIFAKQCKAIPV